MATGIRLDYYAINYILCIFEDYSSIFLYLYIIIYKLSLIEPDLSWYESVYRCTEPRRTTLYRNKHVGEPRKGVANNTCELHSYSCSFGGVPNVKPCVCSPSLFRDGCHCTLLVYSDTKQDSHILLHKWIEGSSVREINEYHSMGLNICRCALQFRLLANDLHLLSWPRLGWWEMVYSTLHFCWFHL